MKPNFSKYRSFNAASRSATVAAAPPRPDCSPADQAAERSVYQRLYSRLSTAQLRVRPELGVVAPEARHVENPCQQPCREPRGAWRNQVE